MTCLTIKPGEDRVLFLPGYDKAQPRIQAPGDPAENLEAFLYRTLGRARANGRETALMVLRVGDYRELTETFGAGFTRELIAAVETRLGQNLRDQDMARKIGEDEFAIVLGDLKNIEDVSRIAQRLVESCKGHYELNMPCPLIKVTAGIALYPVDAEHPTQLLRYAHIALHRADPGMHPCNFFSQELLNRQQHKIWMEVELERALAEDRFVLHYQPQYSVNDHAIVGVEALVRIVTDSGEMIQPDQFIAIAEDNGFIVEIGNWVIHEACRRLAAWRSAGSGIQRMAVNVSPRQLASDQLLDVIEHAVTEFNLDYSDLELEITEQRMFDYMPLAEDVLHELHSRGVRIAVDDFGTGYSSFAYLANMPIDMFKMDRSFLSRVTTDRRAGQLVSSMIDMAKGLNLEIVAEGIETEEQYRFLQTTGCDFGQGFGLARPQTASAIEQLLFPAREGAVA